MTVEQLIEALQQMPQQAVVVYEGDGGISLIAGLALQENGAGIPDEVVLFPSLDGD